MIGGSQLRVISMPRPPATEPFVFIASPGDVGVEKQAVFDLARELTAFLPVPVQVARWEDLILSGDETYQPQIQSPADPLCVATICIFGERLGSAIRGFPDTGVGELPRELAQYCARNGIRISIERKDYGSASALPMTGTLFEFLEACRGPGKVLLMIKADPDLVRNRGADPMDRGLGLGEHLTSVMKSTGSAAANKSRSLADYTEQIEWLARFYDTLIFREGAAHPHQVFRTDDELKIEVRRWLASVLSVGRPGPDQLFKGTESYGIEDWSGLFGREADIRGIIDRLLRGQRRAPDAPRPFRVIYGRSGVGKSSLVKAGVAGRLERQGSIGGRRFVAVELTSDDLGIDRERQGTRPAIARLGKRIARSAGLRRLALEVWQHPPATPPALLNMLRSHLAHARAAGGELIPIVVLDQFEEALKLRHNVASQREFDTHIPPVIAALDHLTAERLAWALVCIPHELASDGRPQLSAAAERSLLGLWQNLDVVRAAVRERGAIETHQISASVDDTFLGAILRGPFEVLGPGLDDTAYDALRRQLEPITDGDHVPLPLVSAHLRALYEQWARRQVNSVPRATDREGENEGTITEADVAGLTLARSIDRLGEAAIAAFRRTGASDAQRTLVRLLRHLVSLDVRREDGVSGVYTRLMAIGIGPSRSRGIGPQEVALADIMLRFRLLARVGSQKVRLVHACVLDDWQRAKQWLAGDSELLRTQDDLRLELDLQVRRRPAGPMPAGLIERSQRLLVAAADAEFLAHEERRLIIDAVKQQFASGAEDGTHTHFLHAALRAREPELIAHHLAAENRRRIDPNAPEADDLQKPPLVVAAEEDQLDAVSLLLAAGADPARSDASGRTVLHALALAGDDQRASVVIGEVLARIRRGMRQQALDRAAKPNGWTALHLAAARGSTPIASALLAAGSDRLLRSQNGFLPIHFAARHADSSLVRMLLQSHHRRQTSETVRDGETVLMHAGTHGSAETIALLLERKANLQRVDAHGATPLHYAARAGNIAALAFLLERARLAKPLLIDQPDADGATPLMLACSNGGLEAMRLLLRSGCTANLRSHAGETALTLASRRGDARIVAELISSGRAATGEANDAGMTALHIAAHYGFVTIVDELLSRGADVNARTDMGRTPLHLAAREGHDRAIARLLAHPSISVATQSGQGQTALHLAAFSGHLAAVELIARCMSRAEINLRDLEVTTDSEPGSQEVVLANRNSPELAAVDTIEPYGDTQQGSATPLNPLASDPSLQIAARDRADAVEHVDTDIADEHGADRARGRRTALYSAAQSGHLKIVDSLLGAGADPTIADRRGVSPLLCAAFHGHVEVARRLMIALAADPKALRKPDAMQRTVLHAAAFSGDPKLFESALAIESDAIESKDAFGQTPLLTAAVGLARRSLREEHGCDEAGPLRIIDRLLDLKARLDSVTNDKLTVLHYAALSNSVTFFTRLIERCDPALARNFDNKRRTPLHLASSRGTAGIVEALVGLNADVFAADADGFTPLHRAAFAGHAEVARVLLERVEHTGADALPKLLNARSQGYGKSPLHCAADAGSSELVQLLIDKGSNLEARTWVEASTALHLAALKGHDRVITALAKSGADLNARDALGGTPLGGAARKGHLHAVEALIGAGADINAPGFAGTPVPPSMVGSVPGHSALATAATFGRTDVATWLIANGASLAHRGARGMTPLHAAASGVSGQLALADLLLQAGANPRARDDAGLTPIHTAALVGNVEVVAGLLDRGLTARGAFDSTLVHTAARYGRIEILKLLKARSLKLNASDALGRTPLHEAVSAYPRSGRAVTWLLDNGADPNLRDRAGDLPAHLAAKAGQIDVLKPLLAKFPKTAARTDSRGLTVLHRLVLRGEPLELSALTAINPPLTGNDKQGNTPVVFAALLAIAQEELATSAQTGRPPAPWLRSLPPGIAAAVLANDRLAVFRILLRFKDALHVRDKTGCSILHFSAAAGSVPVMRSVLRVATPRQINLKDANGKTALDHARDQGHAALVALLLEKGAIETGRASAPPGGAPSVTMAPAHAVPEPARSPLTNGREREVATQVAKPSAPAGAPGKPPSFLVRLLRSIVGRSSNKDRSERNKRR
jgi:ankyrin repeat protein